MDIFINKTINMTGVIIGRFQVPYLHLGHIYLISNVLQKYGDCGILLGTSPNNTLDERNPFTIGHRREIIYRIFPLVKVVPIYDIPNNDEKWSDIVDSLCQIHFGDVTLCHSRDSFKSCYKGSLPLDEFPELEGYSGTKLRKQHKPWSDKEV